MFVEKTVLRDRNTVHNFNKYTKFTLTENLESLSLNKQSQLSKVKRSITM